MQLTAFTDYSLRVLIYLGSEPAGFATIDRIADAYGISSNHLMKVVHRLAKTGYLETLRGRGGGLRLARAPESINVGELVRQTEDGFALVECFEKDGDDCVISPCCVLKRALHEATDAFLAVLDGYSLADLLAPRRPLARLLQIVPATRALRRR